MRRPLGRRHDVQFSVLDLAKNHRLGDIVAGLGKLDAAIERLHVGFGQRYANLFGIEGLRSLEGVFPHQHRGSRLGGLIRNVGVTLVGFLEQLVVIPRRSKRRAFVAQRFGPTKW